MKAAQSLPWLLLCSLLSISLASLEAPSLEARIAQLQLENDQLRAQLGRVLSETVDANPYAAAYTGDNSLKVSTGLEAEGKTEKSPEGLAERIEEQEGTHGVEEEEEFTAVDVGCSFMLLGALLFAMVLFYLVNYPDDDIRKYSWQIISTTISIFAAVLIFTGVEELVEALIIEPCLGAFPSGAEEAIRVLLGFFIFLLWFYIMQFVTAFFSNHLLHHLKKDDDVIDEEMRDIWVIAEGLRADNGYPIDRRYLTGKPVGSKAVASKEGREVFIVKKENLSVEGSERRTKCWSMLFAHMAGFAFISAGGDLQHSPAFLENFWMLLLSVVICIVFLLALFGITDYFRPEPKEYEEAEAAAELYEEEVEEAEDDCFCLAVSFLFVQAIKFGLTGVMPGKLGIMPEDSIPFSAVMWLYGIGLLCIVVTFFAVRFTGRAANLVVGTFADSFAWCALFATRWLLEHMPFLKEAKVSPSSIEGRVFMSVVLSLCALVVIIVLDRIEDSQADKHDDASNQVHRTVKNVITGLSILIGFTWEHSFDGGVEAIASITEEPLTIQVTGAVVISIVVIPAWRKFILAKLLELEKEQKERKKAKAIFNGEAALLKDDFYAQE